MKMHVVAELGQAAHWYYKDLLYRPDIASTSSYKTAWRSKEQMHLATSPAELMGLAKKQLLKDRVFVVLGDKATVLNLRKGATALDAAFAIHSSLGLRTSSINVNGKESKLDRILDNGDIISVTSIDNAKINLTANKLKGVVQAAIVNDGVPNPPVAWLSIVKTDAAKRVLKSHFHKQTQALQLIIGAIQMLMVFSLNQDKILARNYDCHPSAAQLARFAKQRCNKELSNVLMDISSAPTQTRIQEIMGKLLDIAPEELTVTSQKVGLQWCRLQVKHGFADKRHLSIMVSLIYDILPSFGFDIKRLESRWATVTGSACVVDRPSPYFNSLREHLVSNNNESLVASTTGKRTTKYMRRMRK
jgi:(p)ppGpp synthase/HD superfamily hydrolase